MSLENLSELVAAELNGAPVAAADGEVGGLPILEVLKWVRENKETLLKIYEAVKQLIDVFKTPAAGDVAAVNPAVILMVLQVVVPLLKDAWPKVKELFEKFRDRKSDEAYPQL